MNAMIVIYYLLFVTFINVCHSEYGEIRSNNMRVVHRNSDDVEQNSLNNNPSWKISDDIDENIATIQHSLDSINMLQKTMQSVYHSFHAKIDEYTQIFEKIIQSIMKDTYETMNIAIDQQLITNITSSLSKLKHYKQSKPTEIHEIKQIMVDYYRYKEESIHDIFENEIGPIIFSRDEIPKLIQQVFTDTYSLLMPLKEYISPVDAKKIPGLTDHKLWVLPHAFPYINEIKDELRIYNITFYNREIISKQKFIDWYKYAAILSGLDPLSNILPIANYEFQISKFFDQITSIQQQNNLEVNDSVWLFEIDRNSISDEWQFEINILGPIFMGEYILEFNPNTINGKCMKWWKGNYTQQTNGFNLGCVSYN